MSDLKEYKRQWSIRNREKIRKFKAQWNKDNPDKRILYDKKYYENNHNEIGERNRQWRKNNPEKMKESREKWKINNPEKLKMIKDQWCKDNPEYNKQYRTKNKENILEYQKKYNTIKRKTNIKYSLNCRITLAIWRSLKGNKNGQHWEDLVGYTLNDLIKHLKKTMPKGYTWQDYLEGKLHIDHIIPRSIFNFTNPEHIDFKHCWALKNLRLLSVKENLSKSNKLSRPFQPALLF